MQRWLASQMKGPPTVLILLGLAIIGSGVLILVSASGAVRYGGLVFIPIGAFNTAIGIAALRERRSDNSS